jgi:hypothetical protein
VQGVQFPDVLDSLIPASVHPECFFHGYRLVGVDGTQFSVVNTPAILATQPLWESYRNMRRVDHFLT